MRVRSNEKGLKEGPTKSPYRSKRQIRSIEAAGGKEEAVLVCTCEVAVAAGGRSCRFVVRVENLWLEVKEVLPEEILLGLESNEASILLRS